MGASPPSSLALTKYSSPRQLASSFWKSGWWMMLETWSLNMRSMRAMLACNCRAIVDQAAPDKRSTAASPNHSLRASSTDDVDKNASSCAAWAAGCEDASPAALAAEELRTKSSSKDGGNSTAGSTPSAYSTISAPRDV